MPLAPSWPGAPRSRISMSRVTWRQHRINSVFAQPPSLRPLAELYTGRPSTLTFQTSVGNTFSCSSSVA